jgi:hypothetical protein
MGFLHVGWASIVVGVALLFALIDQASAMALLAGLLGYALIVTGLLCLWLGSMESRRATAGERWRRRGTQ